MVRGTESFREWFRGYEEQYVLIGGTACDTTMDFIQSDAISDTVKSTTYRMYFVSEDGEKISNENTYVADSREKEAQKRIFRVRFTFKNRKYDRNRQYYLVVTDDATGMEASRHPIITDIAMADDFGFGF